MKAGKVGVVTLAQLAESLRGIELAGFREWPESKRRSWNQYRYMVGSDGYEDQRIIELKGHPFSNQLQQKQCQTFFLSICQI